MPDYSSRTKANLVSLVLKSPAEIHVVARSAKDWIKSLNGLQGFAAEGHVATGYVFRGFIVQ